MFWWRIVINRCKITLDILKYFLKYNDSVIISGAGTGSLGLAIEGPSEAKMTCKDNRDGSCSVEYTPTESGEYDVSIQFAEKHISGSPFKVHRSADDDAHRPESSIAL